MKRLLCLIAFVGMALSARATVVIPLEITGVTSNATYLSSTNQIGANGEIVAIMVYAPTNVTVKIDTAAGHGASYTSRSLVSERGLTNMIVVNTNNVWLANDWAVISAKSAGLGGTTSTVVRASIIVRER